MIDPNASFHTWWDLLSYYKYDCLKTQVCTPDSMFLDINDLGLFFWTLLKYVVSTQIKVFKLDLIRSNFSYYASNLKTALARSFEPCMKWLHQFCKHEFWTMNLVVIPIFLQISHIERNFKINGRNFKIKLK